MVEDEGQDRSTNKVSDNIVPWNPLFIVFCSVNQRYRKLLIVGIDERIVLVGQVLVFYSFGQGREGGGAWGIASVRGWSCTVIDVYACCNLQLD